MTSIVYDFLKERNVPGQTLVVGSSMAWGALIAQEKLGIPMVTLHLQPSVLMSACDTPVYNGLIWPSKLPRPLKKGFLAIIDSVTDRITTPEINKFRASVGLPPVRRVLREWTHSPYKTIGLFPEWFAPRQPDWPVSVELTDFPLYDADDLQAMPTELDAFLKTGPPPVVFTAGSAMKQARAIFAVSAEACRRLGCRGVLVNKFPDQLPVSLPPGVIAVGYAPFSRLFRKAAAVIHHGGIGTTAQAFAAGVPQIVTPFAHDQFDNAHRVERLVAGKRILPKNYTAGKAAETLRQLMRDEAVRGRALRISRRLEKNEGIAKTCDALLRRVS